MTAAVVSRRPWLVNALTGAGLLALLALARAMASASRTAVYFAGRELQWGCSFRQAFGVPCPACGMTRSVLLALHGQLNEALAMNPAGPLLVAGWLLFGVAMLVSAGYQFAGRMHASPDALQRRVALSIAAYAGLTVAVLVAHWVRIIA